MSSRSNPRLWDKSYLVLYELNKDITHSISHEIPVGVIKDIILDIGCGTKPYNDLFQEKSESYIGVDLQKSPDLDILCSAEKLPFKNNSVDLVFSSQVLEHVENPNLVINEMHRVLKDKGVVVLSTHGIWNKHTDYDYWRWTDRGLLKIFSQFKDVKIKCNGGTVLCFFQILNLYIAFFPIGKKVLWSCSNVLGRILDKIFHYERYLIINYLVIAKK